MIKEINDDEKLKTEIEKIFKEEFASMTDEDKSKMGDPEVYLKMQMKTITSPWFKYFVKYDPVPVLEKVKCPVLALIGEKIFRCHRKKIYQLLKMHSRKAEIKILK